MAVIRLPENIWAKVHAHLFSGLGEHFAFMLAEHCRSIEGPVFLVKDAIYVPDGCAKVGIGGWTVRIKGRFVVEWSKERKAVSRVFSCLVVTEHEP